MEISKRLAAARKTLTESQELIAEIERDIAIRESDPNFSTARKMFEAGWRLIGWEHRKNLTDTDYSIELACKGKHIYFWGDGEDRQVEGIYPLVGLLENSESEEVLRHLSNLTEEVG